MTGSQVLIETILNILPESITDYVIKHLIENKYKVFHFMRGDYDCKKGWMHKDREHISGSYLFPSRKAMLGGRF